MLVPKLRFSEFTDEWKQVELEKIVKRIIRKNKNNESQLPLTISAQYGLIDQTSFFNRNVSSNDLSGYYLLYNGDFAYNKSYSNGYPWGTIKKLSKYDKGVVSSLYICFKNNENISANYLEQYFETSKWYKEISLVSVEGARNHGLLNISVNDFFASRHYIPQKAEQNKIGDFLSLIDKKIELQSKKIEVLKLYSESTKNNFFNSILNCELISLKKILKERKTFSQKGLEYPHVTLSKDGIYDKGERYNRDFLVKSEEKKYKITFLNDLCYNPANLKFGVICLNEYGSAIFSPIYVTYEINKNINPNYIAYYLTRNIFIKQARKYEQGTVFERMSVSPEDFVKFEIPIPSRATQDQIVEHIKKINNKLLLEEDKLKLLIKYKKGLMQEMFV